MNSKKLIGLLTIIVIVGGLFLINQQLNKSNDTIETNSEEMQAGANSQTEALDKGKEEVNEDTEENEETEDNDIEEIDAELNIDAEEIEHNIENESKTNVNEDAVIIDNDKITEEVEEDSYNYKSNPRSFVYNGIIYEQNEYYSSDESAPDNVVFNSGQFITLEFTNTDNKAVKSLEVIDNKASHNTDKALNYLKSTDNYVYVETINHDIIQVIKQKVREYDVSEKGIVFNGYHSNKYCFYYDFETEAIIELQDKQRSYEVSMSNNYIINGSYDELISYELKDRINEIARISIADLVAGQSFNIDSTYSLDVIEREGVEYYLATFDKERKMFILDPRTLSIVKEIDGKWSYTYEDGNIYYTLGSFVLSYNPTNNQTVILYNGGNPIIRDISGNRILCSVSIDAQAEYETIDLNSNLMEEYQEYDYILFEQFWKIYSSAYLLDQVKSEFIPLAEYTMGVEYELKDKSISYRTQYDDNKLGERVWTDMIEYDLVDGYSIKIIEQ